MGKLGLFVYQAASAQFFAAIDLIGRRVAGRVIESSTREGGAGHCVVEAHLKLKRTALSSLSVALVPRPLEL